MKSFLYLLLALAGAVVAHAQVEPFRLVAGFVPVLRFSETHSESVVTVPDESQPGLVFREVRPAQSSSVSMVANISGINLATLDGSTTFTITVGDLVASGTLGNDLKYVVGKTSVFIPANGFTSAGAPLGTTGVKLSWTSTRLTVSITRKLGDSIDPGPIYADRLLGVSVPAVKDMTEATLQFGPISTSVPRLVYFSGSSRITTGTYGSGASAEQIDTQAVSLSGAGDFTVPTIALRSPRSGSFTGPNPLILGTATDGHGLANVVGSTSWSLPSTLPDTWGTQTANWSMAASGVAPGTHRYTFTAVDQSGNSSAPLVVSVVNAMPAPLVGRWDALLAPQGASGLHGHFYLLVTNTGSYTGRLSLASASYSLTGLLQPGGVLEHTVSRGTLLPALRLVGSVPDLAAVVSGATLTGTLSVQSAVPETVASFTAQRSPWSTTNLAPTDYAGSFRVHLAAATAPSGRSFISFTTARTGAASASLRTADGYALTWAGVLGASGQLSFFQALYSGKGSMSGSFSVSAGSPGIAPSSMNWLRGASVADQQFPAGFSYSLATTGQRVVALGSGMRVLGASTATPNARITLEGDGITGSLTQDFTITSTGAFSVPGNVQLITATHSASSGLVTGTFRLPGTTVTASYVALISGTEAYGYYVAAAPTGSAAKRFGKVSFAALP